MLSYVSKWYGGFSSNRSLSSVHAQRTIVFHELQNQHTCSKKLQAVVENYDVSHLLRCALIELFMTKEVLFLFCHYRFQPEMNIFFLFCLPKYKKYKIPSQDGKLSTMIIHQFKIMANNLNSVKLIILTLPYFIQNKHNWELHLQIRLNIF